MIGDNNHPPAGGNIGAFTGAHGVAEIKVLEYLFGKIKTAQVRVALAELTQLALVEEVAKKPQQPSAELWARLQQAGKSLIE